MKISQQLIFTIFIILFLMSGIAAQDFKIKLSKGNKLVFNQIENLTIEGYNGSELVVKGQAEIKEQEERAQGLQVFEGSGNVDNTGLGLSVVESGNEFIIDKVLDDCNCAYTIMVPNHIDILFRNKVSLTGFLSIENVDSEIEISANYTSIYLENITGPVSINSVYGNVEAIFKTLSQQNPSTIKTSYGLIDISLPEGSTTDLKAVSTYGNMYTDFEFDEKDIKHTVQGHDSRNCSYCKSAERSTGKINGGGVLLDLSAGYSNIYLRKRK